MPYFSIADFFLPDLIHMDVTWSMMVDDVVETDLFKVTFNTGYTLAYGSLKQAIDFSGTWAKVLIMHLCPTVSSVFDLVH